MTFWALIEKKIIAGLLMWTNFNNWYSSEVQAKSLQLLLSLDIKLALSENTGYVRKQENHIYMRFIMERDQRRQSTTGILKGSKQMTDLRYLILLSVGILCNNQKPLTTRQQEFKLVIYLFHISCTGKQFTPTARPHSGSPQQWKRAEWKQDLMSGFGFVMWEGIF